MASARLENRISRRQKSLFSTSAFLRFSLRSKSSRSSSGHMERGSDQHKNGLQSSKTATWTLKTRLETDDHQNSMRTSKGPVEGRWSPNNLDTPSPTIFDQKIFLKNSELGCLTSLMKPTKKIAFKLLLNISYAINQHGAINNTAKVCCTGKRLIIAQLHRVNEAIQQKRPDRKGQMILLHGNARPHVAQGHPPYSPDLAPTDYHLFRSISNHMRGTIFDDEKDLKTWLNNFFDTRPGVFWWNGINKLVERWEEVVNNNGEYIID
ncbi:hypothetical protein LAZ67_20001217 [Cordylochernes scorpioides]|uniref:Transposase n=1 Tax=Cordylochernes scorpioides TaxID=51811 RepID=A0ABY6LKQ4_9ARAC|nr:hypothetical protein LAZ67_20001217 [Cordylochernes scorpioides]